ncbi:hypothetical protein HYV71_02480 [Candidatus Uhrbacteria bacterium]|nr:hypothetical protein [Candidatus Uhrbacteria bacterium]
MGKKAKITLRHRVIVQGTIEEFVLLGDFLREFHSAFAELANGHGDRRGDLVIEVVPEVDSRRREPRLPGWFRVGSTRAEVVLKSATNDQIGRFAETLRKEWFPTEAEKKEKESERRRRNFGKLLDAFSTPVLRALLATHVKVDSAPLKTD